MKLSDILSIFLASTLLTNCGGGDGGNDNPDDKLTEKVNEGIAIESQPGDPVRFVEAEHLSDDKGTFFVEAEHLSEDKGTFVEPDNSPSSEELLVLINSLPDELSQFLVKNHVERKYFTYKQNFDALNAAINLYAPDWIRSPQNGEFLDPAVLKTQKSSLELGALFYKSRQKEFENFNFQGDIKTVKEWSTLKKLGKYVDLFDPWLLDQKLNKTYFPVTIKKLRNPANSNTNEITFYYEALFYTEAEALEFKAIADSFEDAKRSYEIVTSKRDGTRESFTDLNSILQKGVFQKVSDIISNPEMSSSLSKGVSLINETIRALIRTDKYYIKTLTSEYKKSVTPLTMQQLDLETLIEWGNQIGKTCIYRGARNTPLNMYDAKLPNLFLVQGIHFNKVAQRLKLTNTVNAGSMVTLMVNPILSGGNARYYHQIIDDNTSSEITPLEKELYDAIITEFEGTIVEHLKTVPEFAELFTPTTPDPAASLSAGTLGDISGNISLRQARTSATGFADLRAFNVNGAAGESIALGMPLFVQLKGDVSSSKATEAATGSVAYRLGNTVIGAIQGYANSGDGFGIEGRQFETSVVASHSFGSFFIEGQLGSVSATHVHSSNWKGMRSQVTLGLDTEFVSPFVQLTHRQLDRSGLDLNQTTGFVGLDMDVAKLKADSYSVDARLTAKVGYGEKAWSVNATDLGTTTGVSSSVEWAYSLNLNSGLSFSTLLNLDSTSKAYANVKFSVER